MARWKMWIGSVYLQFEGRNFKLHGKEKRELGKEACRRNYCDADPISLFEAILKPFGKAQLAARIEAGGAEGGDEGGHGVGLGVMCGGTKEA